MKTGAAIRETAHHAIGATMLFAVGLAASPLAAQTEQVAPTETPAAADPAPAAETSGWLDIGTWGIIALIVIAALVAWFVFFRPRARPEQRRRP